ncbi:MAG TPA: hypothetical protein VFQ80_09195 [Thermomicrobiales bacterium]|nr:hypothetical protein [Thermomicrobiales bacterium]
MDYAAVQLTIAGMSATLFAIIGGFLLAASLSSGRDERHVGREADAGRRRGDAAIDARTARELCLLPLGWAAIVAWSALHAVLSPQEVRDRGIAERSLLFLSVEFLAFFVLMALAQGVGAGDRPEEERTGAAAPASADASPPVPRGD